MANRYWVGGTNSNWVSFGNWAATSGGAATASVPTSADDVFFDANSGSGTVYISAAGAGQIARANNLTCTGYTGTIDLSSTGYANYLYVYGNIVNGSGMTWQDTSAQCIIVLKGTSKTITSNGRAIDVSVQLESASYTLADALSVRALASGTSSTFSTANYNVTVTYSLNVYAPATLNFGSSTVTTNTLSIESGVTVNAGTSTISFPTTVPFQPSISVAGATLYNVTGCVQNSGYASRGFTVTGGFTCNNLTFSGSAASPGGNRLTVGGNITVNGTLTLDGGSLKTRMFVCSDKIGTIRTITANACTASYVDFASITIAGAAAPISGTSLGDAKRNSGITFPAAKTVYLSAGAAFYISWNDTNVWATSSGGVGSDANYPLAQDTAIVDDNSIGASRQFTINSSLAYAYVPITTLTFATRTTSIPVQTTNELYALGDVTLCSSASGQITIHFGNSSPVTFTPYGVEIGYMYVDCDGSTVSLGGNATVRSTVYFNTGTFSIGSYTATFSAAFNANVLAYAAYGTCVLDTGSGVIDMQGSGTLISAANTPLFSVSGTGTIKFSSSSSKAITMTAGVSFSATIDQACSGILDITTGSTYANITNSYSATGATTVRLTAYSVSNATPYVFTSFNLSGASGKNCTFTATGGRAVLQRSSGTWYMGANSTDAGNNSGLVFAAGGGVDYLTVSNINGTTAQNGFLIFC